MPDDVDGKDNPASENTQPQWTIFRSAIQFIDWLRNVKATTTVGKTGKVSDGSELYAIDGELSAAWRAAVDTVLSRILNADPEIMPVYVHGLANNHAFPQILNALITKALT